MSEATHPNQKRLEEFVLTALTTPEFTPDEVSAYLFRDEDGGIRIAELSYTKRTATGMGGGSWMSSDYEASAVLFAAERFLLFVNEPVLNVDTWETNLDLGQEHEQQLYHALTGKFSEWHERPATHNYDGPGQQSPITKE
jgi:hypothetical protein